MDGIEHPARLTVGVVGAGRVGAVLGAALARAGHRVTGAYAVSDASRARAADLLPGVPLADVATVVAGAELVLLAVPDDALAHLVAGLSATGVWQAGQMAVHTSGRHGVAVLEPAPRAPRPAARPAPGDDLHGHRDGPRPAHRVRLRGDHRRGAAPVAEALVLEMGGAPVWVAEGDRLAYHAALAHGANHLVTLTTRRWSCCLGPVSTSRAGSSAR